LRFSAIPLVWNEKMPVGITLVFGGDGVHSVVVVVLSVVEESEFVVVAMSGVAVIGFVVVWQC
jgi:hypothetical protein